jgi:hypothetical protein
VAREPGVKSNLIPDRKTVSGRLFFFEGAIAPFFLPHFSWFVCACSIFEMGQGRRRLHESSRCSPFWHATMADVKTGTDP